MESRDSDEADVVVSADPLLRRKAAAELRLSVRGMAEESRELGALYDKVKFTWCAVNNRARRLRTGGSLVLDREPDNYELRTAARGSRS